MSLQICQEQRQNKWKMNHARARKLLSCTMYIDFGHWNRWISNDYRSNNKSGFNSMKGWMCKRVDYMGKNMQC